MRSMVRVPLSSFRRPYLLRRFYPKPGFDCPLCHLPTIFTSEVIIIKTDERVPPCPVCGIRSNPTMVRSLRKEKNSIEKIMEHAKTTKRPFKKIVLPGVVILPNGNYFSTHPGMGRR